MAMTMRMLLIIICNSCRTSGTTINNKHGNCNIVKNDTAGSNYLKQTCNVNDEFIIIVFIKIVMVINLIITTIIHIFNNDNDNDN